MRGAGVADVRRAALRPGPRHRRRRADRACAAAGTRTTRARRGWRCGCSAACTGWCWSGRRVGWRRTTRAWAATGTRVHGVPAFIELLDRDHEAVRAWLDRPPQTNEVGRATALMGGLLHLPEQAARAGAALRDRLLGRAQPAGRPVRYVDTVGDPVRGRAVAGALRPAWRGNHLTPWPDLQVVGGGGLRPRPRGRGDHGGPAGADGVRVARPAPPARAAAGCARAGRATAPPDVRRQGAGGLPRADRAVEEGATTVVWHSVMWQYLPTDEQERTAARIEALGEQATATAPLVHLFLEPTRRDARPRPRVPRRADHLAGRGAPDPGPSGTARRAGDVGDRETKALDPSPRAVRGWADDGDPGGIHGRGRQRGRQRGPQGEDA